MATVSIEFDGGLVVLDQHGRVHVLNPGAAAIWTLIDAGCSREQAADLIAEQGRVSRTVALEYIDAVDVGMAVEPAAGRRAETRAVSSGGPPRTYRIGTTGFAISSEDDETRLRVESVLADVADPVAEAGFLLHVAAGSRGEMRLLKDGAEVLTSSCSGEMAGAIFQAILEATNPGIDWLGLMHGAAVGCGGSAILLPGSSGAGKSTLAAYLAARGADYLTDDLIALAADGRVVPWPTRISAKRGSWPLLRPLYPVLDELPEVELLERRIKFIPVGTRPWARPPQPVAAFVFPQWNEIKDPGVRELSPTEALVKLVEERLWLGYPITEVRLRRFLAWLPTLPAFSIRYRSLEQAKQQLESLSFTYAGLPRE